MPWHHFTLYERNKSVFAAIRPPFTWAIFRNHNIFWRRRRRRAQVSGPAKLKQPRSRRPTPQTCDILADHFPPITRHAQNETLNGMNNSKVFAMALLPRQDTQG
jgi:hypothetical protein